MRVPFVSNVCPPAYLGGSELACRDVADGRAGRGYEVAVAFGSQSMHGWHARVRRDV